ncbi:lysylphosphatidylglycerol synthase transmembrane domain-containing protein [Sporolituus thermophilus]|uniref:Phosphatidylglycerol lysyltransferase n=1 Tax=Sporolituus thermophilus DSM 23256 TaxID=1123285 RepID=A0A1G7K7S5_9FIRM|nr:lysylphosphatidylglycerol synthase transmembrane domain-containing protein [Sporolituus thermophilus]SDF33303.1 hypothetical protein SAMN05660235_01232 [Sporolituus thermophilus DSM 23256]
MKQVSLRLAASLGLLLAATAAVIFATFDAQMFIHLRALRLWAVLLVLGLVATGLYFDAYRLKRMAELAGAAVTLKQCVPVILGNYFFALLTPGATGGPVAQVALLRKAGVPVGKATVLAVVRTLLSLFVLVLCLPVVVYLDDGIAAWFPKHLAVGAAMAIVVAGCGMLKLMRVRRFALLFKRVACRLLPGKARQLLRFFRDLEAALTLLGQNGRGLAEAFVYTIFSLLALYGIVPVLFAGMGAPVAWGTVLGRVVLLNFVLYFAPTPGGAGVAEGGFVFLFSTLYPASMVGIAALLWRLFSEYLPFMLGFIAMVRVFGYHFLKNSQLLAADEGGKCG